MAEPQFALCPQCELRHGVPDLRIGLNLLCAGCGHRWKDTPDVALQAFKAEDNWDAAHGHSYRFWLKQLLEREAEKVEALKQGRWA